MKDDNIQSIVYEPLDFRLNLTFPHLYQVHNEHRWVDFIQPVPLGGFLNLRLDIMEEPFFGPLNASYLLLDDRIDKAFVHLPTSLVCRCRVRSIYNMDKRGPVLLSKIELGVGYDFSRSLGTAVGVGRELGRCGSGHCRGLPKADLAAEVVHRDLILTTHADGRVVVRWPQTQSVRVRADVRDFVIRHRFGFRGKNSRWHQGRDPDDGTVAVPVAIVNEMSEVITDVDVGVIAAAR